MSGVMDAEPSVVDGTRAVVVAKADVILRTANATNGVR
jgi:hypothetical protein